MDYKTYSYQSLMYLGVQSTPSVTHYPSLAQPIGYLIGVLAVFGSLIGIIWYVFRGRGGIGGLVGSIRNFFTSFL